MDHLDRSTIPNIKCCSPDFVTSDNFEQATLEYKYIQRSVPVNGYAFVVKRDVPGHLRMKPYLLLSKREWHDCPEGTRVNSVCCRTRRAGLTTQIFQKRAFCLGKSTAEYRCTISILICNCFSHAYSPDAQDDSMN